MCQSGLNKIKYTFFRWLYREVFPRQIHGKILILMFFLEAICKYLLPLEIHLYLNKNFNSETLFQVNKYTNIQEYTHMDTFSTI